MVTKQIVHKNNAELTMTPPTSDHRKLLPRMMIPSTSELRCPAGMFRKTMLADSGLAATSQPCGGSLSLVWNTSALPVTQLVRRYPIDSRMYPYSLTVSGPWGLARNLWVVGRMAVKPISISIAY